MHLKFCQFKISMRAFCLLAICNVSVVILMSSVKKIGQNAEVRQTVIRRNTTTAELWTSTSNSLEQELRTLVATSSVPFTFNGTAQASELFYPILQPQHKLDCEDSTEIVALVHSLTPNYDHRQAIRQTWAYLPNHTGETRVVFVTGKHKYLSKISSSALRSESLEHRDILMGEFRHDVSINTTFPVLLGIKWASDNCKSLKFIYVGTDSTIVNTRRLNKQINYYTRNNLLNARTLIGKITNGLKVKRESASRMHYTSPDWYANDYFPPFCTDESGYIMTRVAAQEFYNISLNRLILPRADVFLGIIAKERNWTVIGDELFTSDVFKNNPCDADAVVTMRAPRKPEELISAWKNLSDLKALLGCVNPDLDIVLPRNVDNRRFLDKVLSYIKNPRLICYDDVGKPRDIFMLVLISTHPKYHDVRSAIRRTWCRERKVLGMRIQCLFTMGVAADETPQLRGRLNAENLKHGDIIQANFLESYQNLTLKVILNLKWMTEHCQHAKFFYKGDDDMFVNFENIISYIKQLRSQGKARVNFFLGSKMVDSVRYSPNVPEDQIYERYHVPDHLYYGRYYPPYCSGGGYVMSTDKVSEMYLESMRTSLINIEDAFQGILAEKVGIEPIGHRGFKSEGFKTDTCSLRDKNIMNIHGMGHSAINLYKVWSRYKTTTANCTDYLGI